MLDLLIDWEFINFNEDDEPTFLKQIGRIKFYCIPNFLCVFDPALNLAKGIQISSNKDLKLKLAEATKHINNQYFKHKQLSLL
jgi:hypothetical protein